MRKGLTEIVFILDKSGSMRNFEEDVIGGFNSTIDKQKKLEGTAYVSTVLFDDKVEVLHDRVDLANVKELTKEDYVVGGCTALLDALGGAIHHIGNVHKYAREEDRPEHTLFIITTDGMENASTRYDDRKVKEMISYQTEKYGWEFIFMAANIDAVKTAEKYGIRKNRAVNYKQDKKGIQACYCLMDDAISTVRKGESLDDSIW